MKKLFYIVFFLLFATVAQAVTTVPLGKNGTEQYLLYPTDNLKAAYFVSTSTTASSTFIQSTTTASTISKYLNLIGSFFQTTFGDCDGALDKVIYDATTGKFSCGTDATGGGSLSGGSANTLTYWIDGTTVSGTSSPTVGYITGTSTTGTSTLPNASTTNLAISGIAPSSLLKLNSNGLVTGATAGTDYETSLTAGDGLTRTVNDIDCDIASASAFGCLSTTDWSMFNAKVSTSGVSSIIAGTTTTALAEGSNLYFTDARARTAVAGLFPGSTTPIMIIGTSSIGTLNATSALNIMGSTTGNGASLTYLTLNGGNLTGGNATFVGVTTTNPIVSQSGTSSFARLSVSGLATTTDLSISRSLTWLGTTYTTSNAFCIALTGSAGLCDGDDASGGGGGGTYPFTPTTNFGQAVSATGTALWLQGSPISLMASGTSYFSTSTVTGDLSVLNGTSDTVTLSVTGATSNYLTTFRNTVADAVIRVRSDAGYGAGGINLEGTANEYGFIKFIFDDVEEGLFGRNGEAGGLNVYTGVGSTVRTMQWTNGGNTIAYQKLGVGSSTPWAQLSVIGTTTSNPVFAFATSTTNFPFFWGSNPYSSSTISLNGIAVSQIGLNFPINGTTTLRDNTYIGGRTVEMDYRFVCPMLHVPVQLTADNSNTCNGWSLDVDSDATFVSPNTAETIFGVPYMFATLNHATPITGDTGAFRMLPIFNSTSSPVMSVTASTMSSTSSLNRVMIGFMNTNWGSDYGTTNPTNGFYFEASSTANNNWMAVVKVNNVMQKYINTGVATSTLYNTASQANTVPRKFRIELSPTGALFFIDDTLVGQYTGTMTGEFLAPIISTATVTTGNFARQVRIYEASVYANRNIKLSP